MIISKSKNFIYIHLDKCGGTSIDDYRLIPKRTGHNWEGKL